ncbi:MAG: sporulation integral membrane protein YtvI [Eubacteriales bacterium]
MKKLKDLNYQRIASVIIVVASVALCAVVLFRYLLIIGLPFFLAWGAALLVRPVAVFLHKKAKFPLRVTSVVLVLLLMGLIGFGLFLLGSRLFRELRDLILRLKDNPDIIEDVFVKINAFLDRLQQYIPTIPDLGKTDVISETNDWMKEFLVKTITDILNAMPRMLGKLVIGLPGFLVSVLVLVISAVYFALDLDRIHLSLNNFIPVQWRDRVKQFKKGAFSTAISYLNSYLTLMFITFVMLLVGFLILDVNYALLLAVIFAFLDLLPVIGVGTMLIPWGAFCLLTGNVRLGAALLILYAIIAIVRQFLEPRILGQNLGIHPLLTLVSMYAGLQLLGFVGMLLGPVVGVAIRAVYKWRKGEPTDKPKSASAKSSAPPPAPPPSPPTGV